MYPKPVQSPHPPIRVGGESDAAMRRAARFGQGWFTFNRTPDEFPGALERLDRELAAAGRSRSADFTVTACPYFNPVTPETVEAYHAAGLDRLIVVCFAFGRDDLLTTLDQLVADVLEPARKLS
jgi:alkanesulfonate monooxygenase SsuD/methylene tetrahydromethanopterin reductase-like flavin-dependent oxidoreductase (luciferase family)